MSRALGALLEKGPTQGRTRAQLLILPVLLLVLAAGIAAAELTGTLKVLTVTVAHLLPRYGPPAAFGLLYLEESGIPLPVPGDLYVVFVGHWVARLPLGWLAAWLALTACVALGATNLYLVSRRWGRRIVDRRGRILQLTPERLNRAEYWFRRWGPWALILGRHVPGLRIPLTVGAGIFNMRYRIFLASVVVSTLVWTAIFLVLGIALGRRARPFLTLHRQTGVVIAVLALVAGSLFLARHLRGTGATGESRDG